MKKRSLLGIAIYASGYSQKRVARLVHLDAAELSKVVCARRPATSREQAKLMKLLGKTAAELGFEG